MENIEMPKELKQAAMSLLFENDWENPMYMCDASMKMMSSLFYRLCGGTEKEMQRWKMKEVLKWGELGVIAVFALVDAGYLYWDEHNEDYLRRAEGIEETPLFDEWRNMTRG